jgi:hypothetical protein
LAYPFQAHRSQSCCWLRTGRYRKLNPAQYSCHTSSLPVMAFKSFQATQQPCSSD